MEQGDYIHIQSDFGKIVLRSLWTSCTVDSRLRPDQRCLENGEYDRANSEKLRLEERQRQARENAERVGSRSGLQKTKDVIVTATLVVVGKQRRASGRHVLIFLVISLLIRCKD
ncbi:hypothetical protein HAX54_020102 [Datura stramonium]|uniref:Uncharacterized protein n=1 Tax=Datura stramonium TaxID=4076 RepID=A0ABS8US07_DATST|nr:hypothetical protein [Datura stramonium]